MPVCFTGVMNNLTSSYKVDRINEVDTDSVPSHMVYRLSAGLVTVRFADGPLVDQKLCLIWRGFLNGSFRVLVCHLYLQRALFI